MAKNATDLRAAHQAVVLVLDRTNHGLAVEVLGRLTILSMPVRLRLGLAVCLRRELLLVDGELDRVHRGLGAEVVHARLEPELPRVEVHGRELAVVGVGNVDVERLGLVDERATVGGHLEDHLLGDLPYGAVELLEVVWDVGDLLQRIENRNFFDVRASM